MASRTKKVIYADTFKQDSDRGKTIHYGIMATVSACIGGLAVAWWYRDTLRTLLNSGMLSNLPKLGSPDAELPESTISEAELGNTESVSI